MDVENASLRPIILLELAAYQTEFLRYAEDAVLDKQHRLVLPYEHTNYAQINGKAVFIGMGQYIEIWSPDVSKK